MSSALVGVMVTIDRRPRLPAAFLLLATILLAPAALAGVSIVEHWPVVLAQPTGASVSIIDVAGCALLAHLLSPRARASRSLTRIRIGHVALGAILAIAAANGLLHVGGFTNLLWFAIAAAAVPLGFVGATWVNPVIPRAGSTWRPGSQRSRSQASWRRRRSAS